MDVIRTEQYLPVLQEIAYSYAFPLDAIEVTDDIQKWCDTHGGVTENNPFRAGKCIRNDATKNYRILLRAEITEGIQQAVIDRIELNGLSSEVKTLNNKKSFLIHLVLHEVAHAQHNDWLEDACDEWAFQEMGRWVK